MDQFEQIAISNTVETPPDTESPETEQKENLEINNTASFQIAIEQGNLKAAEDWLMANKENYDTRWLDHRSRELFKAYRTEQKWPEAKRMVELGQDESAIKGRENKLREELAALGLNYEEI